MKKAGNKGAHGKLIPVRTTKYQDSLLEHCSKRSDRWLRHVKARLEFMQDLIAREVVYHNACNTNFRGGHQIPKTFAKEEPALKKLCLGRPENSQSAQAFQLVIDYIDNTYTDQVTVPELVKLMQSKLTSEDNA